MSTGLRTVRLRLLMHVLLPLLFLPHLVTCLSAGAAVHLFSADGRKPGRSAGAGDRTHLQERQAEVRGDRTRMDAQVRHDVIRAVQQGHDATAWQRRLWRCAAGQAAVRGCCLQRLEGSSNGDSSAAQRQPQQQE